MNIRKTVHIAALLALIALVGTVTYSVMTTPPLRKPPAQRIPFSDGWTLHEPDGTQHSVSFDAEDSLQAPTFSISKQLPEKIQNDTVLILKTGRKWVEATVDGVPLEVEGMHQGGSLGIQTVDKLAAISLSTQHSGRSIVLQINDRSNGERSGICNFYLINRTDLECQKFYRTIPFVLLAIFLFFASMALFTIGLILNKKTGETVHFAILYFSAFVFLAAVWITFDCKVLELFFPYSEAYYLMSFYALMLMPIPFALFARELHTREAWVFDLLALLLTASFLLNVGLLQFGIIHSLIHMVSVTHVLIAVMILAAFHAIVQTYSNLREQGAREALIGISVFAVADCIALGQFYFRTKISYSLIFCIGLVLMVAFLSVSVIRYTLSMAHLAQMSKQNQMRASLAQNELLVSQISTHFFYHMMSTIRTLVKTQPDVAYDSLGALSKYLRYKTESGSVMGSLVKFSDEMKSVNAYISMKKVLLGHRLRVEYENPCEDFYIPVLTIQPLVENAIKHGIEAKPQGGTVKITVSNGGSFYRVVIEDDGNGFGAEVEFSTENASVSQENIKERLKYYGNNRFSIKSAPNLGTRVIVEFEKGLEEQHEDNPGG